MEKRKDLKDWVFRQVHTNNLVYNTCWEDPRCDRQLLELTPESEVVMITSAGCNALDYLLDRPGGIHCIDMNPRQNALLDLKLAAFAAGDFDDLFQLFGDGAHPQMRALYQEQLRPHLPEYAQQFWDRNLHFFDGKGLRRSFYHYSTSGFFAWMANGYLRAQSGIHKRIRQLFEADTLDKQAAIYYEIESKVLNGLVEWFVNRHFTMCLVGVPHSQQKLFVEQYEQGALGFIKECLRKVFTERPVHDNYFYRVYLEGAYTPGCCPSYLERGNFTTLQQEAPKIETHTSTISHFLQENPGQYSHFVLLDHQDWLAANNRPALEEEWRLILENSRPGARILLRSAAAEVDFFPDFVKEAVHFEQEKTAETHNQDRVGTYASVYLGVVSGE